ncbi:hypothetical protein L208DRAFT_399260 [Tricholoma matsutake]|nr:hypothetical protein L208DRAFT_399260 [Tricholoma matsutake 945]
MTRYLYVCYATYLLLKKPTPGQWYSKVLSFCELHDFLNLDLEGQKFSRSKLMRILEKLQDETMLYLGVKS